MPDKMATPNPASFDMLVQAALEQEFSGWDFGWLSGRWHEAPPPWDYRGLITARLPNATALLDVDTGGGEFLATLHPRPPITWATESYAPNVTIAQDRLTPLGITVAVPLNDTTLACPDAHFDLIINRHGALRGPALYRALKPGGTFITQQVGGENCAALNAVLDGPPMEYADWSLTAACDQLQATGLEIVETGEAFPECLFLDIGAVIFYLKVISWQIPDFTVARYRGQLLALHQRLARTGPFNGGGHRFYVIAQKRV